jgi:hypothetical protein
MTQPILYWVPAEGLAYKDFLNDARIAKQVELSRCSQLLVNNLIYNEAWLLERNIHIIWIMMKSRLVCVHYGMAVDKNKVRTLLQFVDIYVSSMYLSHIVV